MMKKTISTLLAMICLLSVIPITVFAKDIAVSIDGKHIVFDQQPVVENGRTLVPLRAIFEALGASVSWDENTQTVISQKGNTIISMTIGKPYFLKNLQSIQLDVPSKVLNGRTLVPVRAIAESFNCSVNWDESTQHVQIVSEVTKNLSNTSFDKVKTFIVSNGQYDAEIDGYTINFDYII